MSESRERKRLSNQLRWEERKRKRLCQRCGDKLFHGCKYQTCKPCRDIVSIKAGSGMRKAATERLRRRLAFIAKTYRTHTLAQQAEALGVVAKTVRWMRWRAGKEGLLPAHGNTLRCRQSTRWEEIMRSQARCGLCGLLEPHICAPSIYELAGSRRGPGG